MARYEHLPIYKQAMDVAVHFEKVVAGFSRYLLAGLLPCFMRVGVRFLWVTDLSGARGPGVTHFIFSIPANTGRAFSGSAIAASPPLRYRGIPYISPMPPLLSALCLT